MKFENSELKNTLEHTKKSFDFGDLFFFEKFVLSELNYGIHLDWSKIEILIESVKLHYGPNFKIGYISNKVNSYSYEPNLWEKFYTEYDFIIASAMICYSEMGYINATIEKQFSSKSLKRCKSIDESVDWILNLEEFKDKNIAL